VDQGASGRLGVPEQQQAERFGTLSRLQQSQYADVKRIAALIARCESTIAGPEAQVALQNLTKALDTYEQLRASNTPLVDYLKQESLFDARDPLTSTQEGMLRAFERDAKSLQALDKIITGYLHGLPGNGEAKAAQASLFRRRRKAELEALRIKNATVSDLLKEARTKPRRYRLAVNDAAAEIFNRLYERRNQQVGITGPVRFDGVFNQPSLVRELLGQLRELAKENKADKPAIVKIGRALKQAAAEDGTAIVYRKASSLPEEAFHRASYLAARIKRLSYRVDARALAETPQLRHVRSTLLERGYNDELGELVEETAAKLFALDDLGLSEQDALEFQRQWFKSFEEINGRGSAERVARIAAELLEDITNAGENIRGERGLSERISEIRKRLEPGRSGGGPNSKDESRTTPDASREGNEGGDAGSSGPVFQRTPELSPRERIFRALIESQRKGQPRGTTGASVAPNRPLYPNPPTSPGKPATAPAPRAPRPTAVADEGALTEAAKTIRSAEKERRLKDYAKGALETFQTAFNSEFTPLRYAERSIYVARGKPQPLVGGQKQEAATHT